MNVSASIRPVGSFFNAPVGDLDDLQPGTIALTGVYCDHFSGGTPGGRLAARQIRYASLGQAISRFRQYGRYWRFERLSARSRGQRGDPHRTVHANSCDGRQHFGIWRRLQCIADALRRFPRCRARKIGRPHPHIEASRSMRRHPEFAKARHGDDPDRFTNSERFDECRVAGCHRIAIHGATLTGNRRLIGAARKTLRLK